MKDVLLKLFTNFSEKHSLTDNAFIVGGAVRDILLEKELKDIDIAIKGDALNIAGKFAKEVGGTFVLLDEKFGVARIVKNSFFLDISMMRGDSIYTDIAERDITINAMAIPLKSLEFGVQSLELIDTYNGRDDLSNRIIKMVSEENLIKDPLRILRIYRFAATLDFSIEEKTLNAAKRLASLTASVAVERIADELRHIIRLDSSYKTIKAMIDDDILFNILPKINPELYKTTEEVLSNPPAYFPDYSEAVSEYFKADYRKICLKLSTIFPDHDSAKQSAIRLKMSKKEAEFVHEMALNRNRILELHEESKGNFDESAAAGFLKEFHDDTYSLAILGMAQDPSAKDFCRKLFAFYNEKFKQRMAMLPIITGDDLIKEFDLKPSPLFKKILDTVEDLVLKGIIVSKEEAMKKVSEMLKTK